MQKILSFDVGIINLSYCVLDKNGIIYKWDNIDLTDRDKIVCCGLTKKNVVCGKVASFIHDNKYYCKTHNIKPNDDYDNMFTSLQHLCHCGKKATNMRDDKYYCKSHNKNYDAMINHKCHCGKNATSIHKELYLCNPHKKQYINNLRKQNAPKSVNKTTNKDPQTVAENLYRKLDGIPNLINDIETVLVENQLALTNPFMKTLSVLLFAYFINKKVKNVKFISACNKLKIPDSDKPEIDKRVKEFCDAKPKTTTVKSKTAQKAADKDLRKSTAIIYTKYLLEKSNSEFKNHLNKYTKLDDLCDSYLQGLYFVNK